MQNESSKNFQFALLSRSLFYDNIVQGEWVVYTKKDSNTSVTTFIEPKAGLEPATYSLRMNCSTNWAISAEHLLNESLLSDSNQRPRDYKSRALANWAKEAGG